MKKKCKTEGCSNKAHAKGLCNKCYDKARYEAKREEVLAKQKEYYESNKESAKAYYESNKESIRAKRKEHYEARQYLKPLYNTWIGIKQRCYDTNAINYKYYGGRGIIVCDRWLNSYELFEKDMGERPEGMTLDRIDVNANYELSNCRWATWTEQNNNRRNNK